MTYKEKHMEQTGATEEEFEMHMIECCPDEDGLEKMSDCNRIEGERGSKCRACWNREMPSTEPKEDAYKEDMHTAYNKGLNDAWELVDKLWYESDKILGYVNLNQVFKDLTPQEALAKLKAYEDSKIEVGDVVLVHDEILGVVTYVTNQNRIYGFDTLGMIIAEIPFSDCKKTGKHLDIQQLLEQIGE